MKDLLEALDWFVRSNHVNIPKEAEKLSSKDLKGLADIVDSAKAEVERLHIIDLMRRIDPKYPTSKEK